MSLSRVEIIRVRFEVGGWEEFKVFSDTSPHLTELVLLLNSQLLPGGQII